MYFDRAYPGCGTGLGHCLSNEDGLVTSLNICTMDADCCATFGVQIVLWCGIGVVYGIYIAKSGVYLTIPLFKVPPLTYFDAYVFLRKSVHRSQYNLTLYPIKKRYLIMPIKVRHSRKITRG